MLTLQLRQLEADGIVARKIYAEVPTRVEYELTAYGQTLSTLLRNMRKWGEQHLTRRNKETGRKKLGPRLDGLADP
jgi:DNA-binding HxlR family transcriptional regulator